MFYPKPNSFIFIGARSFEELPHDDPVGSWQFLKYKSEPPLLVCATFACVFSKFGW